MNGRIEWDDIARLRLPAQAEGLREVLSKARDYMKSLNRQIDGAEKVGQPELNFDPPGGRGIKFIRTSEMYREWKTNVQGQVLNLVFPHYRDFNDATKEDLRSILQKHIDIPGPEFERQKSDYDRDNIVSEKQEDFLVVLDTLRFGLDPEISICDSHPLTAEYRKNYKDIYIGDYPTPKEGNEPDLE